MKTNLTKFAAICVKKGLKGKSLEPKKLQNHSNEKQKERGKKERLEGKEEKKKKTMAALLVFIIATLEIATLVHLAIKLSKKE